MSATANPCSLHHFVDVDVVALTRDEDGSLQVGIHQRVTEPYFGRWALPGVAMRPGERITEAATRALWKLGVVDPATDTPVPEVGSVAVGQLFVADEPHRDPRGDSISAVCWAVVEAPQQDGRWSSVEWVALTDERLATMPFDHTAILPRATAMMAAMLWNDPRFTRAITGEVFSTSQGVRIGADLGAGTVRPSNLARKLSSTAGLAQDGQVHTGGRPALAWRWQD